MRARAIAAGVLAALLAPATAAHAQQFKLYRVTQAHTELGRLVMAYRRFDPAERRTEKYDYEVLLAHPVWGHGYMRNAYNVDCANLTLPASSQGFRYWSEGIAKDLEGAPEEDLGVAFVTPAAGARFVADTICNGKGEIATDIGARESLRQASGGSAARERRPAKRWRVNPLAGLLAAFPTPETSYDSRKMGGAKGRVVIERSSRAGGLTYAAGVIGLVPRPWSSASDAIRYYSRELPSTGARRRITSSNSLTIDAPVSGEAGLYRVVRIEACDLRGTPDWTVEISAEYRTTAERIEAWRFVNNTRSWCL